METSPSEVESPKARVSPESTEEGGDRRGRTTARGGGSATGPGIETSTGLVEDWASQAVCGGGPSAATSRAPTLLPGVRRSLW
eukprot:2680717-Lingulodinium_polyedra.AAC.1